MPPCGTQDDENMMVLWRRSLYWSSSSVAVLAALVVLVIFERRASPYPLHLGRGSLFVPGARFSEQWNKCREAVWMLFIPKKQGGGPKPRNEKEKIRRGGRCVAPRGGTNPP